MRATTWSTNGRFNPSRTARAAAGLGLALFLLIAGTSQAQDVELGFAVGMGGPGGNAHGEGIAADEFGNIYTTGYFEGVVDFDPGSNVTYLTSEGGYDIFVNKLDSDGNFLWAKSLGGASADHGSEIALDQSGHLYITGFFQGTVDFDPGADTVAVTSTGGKDFFVSKLDSNGSFLWTKTFGGSADDYGNGIAVDHLGNVYISGSFENTIDFDPSEGTTCFSSAGNFDSFVQKLDSEGNLSWVRTMGGLGRDSCTDIALDDMGNAYAVGKFAGDVYLNSGTGDVQLSSVGPDDVFLQKLDAAGTLVWVRAMGGGGEAEARGIAVDQMGNVYTTGSFQGTADFDPEPGSAIYSSTGKVDVFVSKLDTDGRLLWTETMGGPDRPFNEGHGWDIEVDASGHVYTSGSFFGALSFGTEENPLIVDSVGYEDGFIQKLDPEGNFVSVRIVGGIYSTACVRSISLDALGRVVSTGNFLGYPDFDPTENVSSLGSRDSVAAFVNTLGHEGDFIWSKAMSGRVDLATGHSIATDSSGNVYTTGEFRGTVDFDPGEGTANLSAEGGTNMYVQKLNHAGRHSWARSIGGAAGFVASNDIAADDAGNIYVTGRFGGTVNFDPRMAGASLVSAGSADIFILKLDTDGMLLWVKTFGAKNSAVGTGLAFDQVGNAYVTGRFSGTIEVGAGSDARSIASIGNHDAFVQKLDSRGNMLWIKNMGGTQYAAGSDVAVDPFGNVYITGRFSETVDFDPDEGTVTLTSEGDSDLFVQKLDPNGRFLWVRSTRDEELSRGINSRIAADHLGDVYITGSFMGTSDFDPGVGIYTLSSAGDSDAFVQKLDTHGDFAWARSVGGASDDFGNDIAVDTAGNVYVTGGFKSYASYIPEVDSDILISEGSYDIFLQKLSPDGGLEWTESIGSRGSDWGSGVTLDALHNIYLTGRFEGTADFDPTGGLAILTINEGNDAFVLKLTQTDAGEGETPNIQNIARDLADAFTDADLNLDGLLSEEEARAAVPALTAEQFATLDGDGDGFLSESELEEHATPSGCFGPDVDGSTLFVFMLLASFLAWW